MGIIATLGRYAWRKWRTDGVAASGPNEPDTIDIFPFVDTIDDFITAAIETSLAFQGGWNASAGTFPGSGAAEKGWAWRVTTAGTVNGVAFRVGDLIIALVNTASTTTYAANWIRVAASLDPVVSGEDVGADTANAIQVTTVRPFSADGGQLLAFTVFEDNTSGTVTLRVTDSTGAVIGPFPLKTAVGNSPAVGGLADGMPVVVQLSSSVFYMLSDQSSAAIQAAAEAALADFRARWVGDFVDDAAADAYLTGAGLTKLTGTAYFNTTSDVWKYWDGAAWQTFPYATVADNSLRAAKMDATDSIAIRDKLEIAKAQPIKMREALVYDMHFGVLRGRGWMTGEAGGEVTYILDGAAAAGATTILLTAGSPKPITAQLIVYLGTDGKYYSVMAANISSNTVTLGSPLEVGIATGGNAFNFYINESHPNEYGYRAITDDLVRSNPGHWREVYRASPESYLGATVTAFLSDNAASPGSSAGGGWSVTPGVAIAGATWTGWEPERTGRYRANIRCNKGAGAGDTTFYVRQNSGAAYTQTHLVETTDVVNHFVDFSVMDNEAIDFHLRKAALSAMFCSDLILHERQGLFLDSLSSSRILLFGDSWFAINSETNPSDFGILDRLRELYPYATVVDYGVGGNDTIDLVARIDDVLDDIRTNGPAIVLVLPGTNDYYGANDPEVVGRNIGIIAADILALDSTPIIFTSSVGSYTESPTRFALSRRYANEIAYHPKTLTVAPIFGADYAELPGGKIFMWGEAASIGSSYTSIDFPVTLPNTTGLTITATVKGAVTATVNCTVGGYSTTGFTCAAEGGSGTVNWMAIGNAP